MTTGFRAGTTTDQTVSLTGRWHRITTELNRYHLRPAGVGLHLLLDITIKSNQFKKQLHRKQLDKVGLFVKTFHLSSNRLQFRLWSFVVICGQGSMDCPDLHGSNTDRVSGDSNCGSWNFLD